MKISECDVLTVPGLDGSGPEHWQTLWEARIARARRVEQVDWSHPKRDAWVAPLVRAVDTASRPVVIVAHSLGSFVVVHAARAIGARVAGAFLVCPPDIERPDLTPVAPDFLPLPTGVLPFPSIVVLSRDDPYATFERGESFARGWGAETVDVGRAGHVNVASGFGPWGEGLVMFERFVERLSG
jgi:predicted alpha/beta hydrolase family esterase